MQASCPLQDTDTSQQQGDKPYFPCLGMRMKWLCAPLQDIGSFQQHSVRLLTSLAQCMAPFSLDYTPSLLEQYMHLFCKTARLQLLLRDYPSRLIVQLYTLVWG